MFDGYAFWTEAKLVVTLVLYLFYWKLTPAAERHFIVTRDCFCCLTLLEKTRINSCRKHLLTQLG